MRYEYECPACGWRGERICKIAERDDQRCEEAATAADAPQRQCDAKLKREEISLNSKMGTQWSRWTGHTD